MFNVYKEQPLHRKPDNKICASVKSLSGNLKTVLNTSEVSAASLGRRVKMGKLGMSQGKPTTIQEREMLTALYIPRNLLAFMASECDVTVNTYLCA